MGYPIELCVPSCAARICPIRVFFRNFWGETRNSQTKPMFVDDEDAKEQFQICFLNIIWALFNLQFSFSFVPSCAARISPIGFFVRDF
jgi:hypothetical protein